jgi:hypothetical protein
MQRKSWMVSIVVMVLLMAVYFFGKTGVAIASYFSLQQSAEAKIESLCVKELNKNKFATMATFSFNHGEKSILAEGRLGPIYPNQYAAAMGLRDLENKREVIAWYAFKHPAKAVLEKKFPLKSTLSSLILMGIAAYFIILGLYVGKNSAHK